MPNPVYEYKIHDLWPRLIGYVYKRARGKIFGIQLQDSSIPILYEQFYLLLIIFLYIVKLFQVLNVIITI